MPSINFKMRLVVLSALFCAMFAIPAVARANDSSISIMMDDDLLLYRSDAIRDNTLRQMKTYGADAVRVTVLWSVVAEHANDGSHKKRFKRLGGANPAAYPKANWDRYDRLDRACQTLAIKCYFNVTGPGPSWTHKKPPSQYAADAKQWKPNPRLFYQFVQAVGKRYSGGYPDENDQHVKLPRINFWSLWNEPNQGGWLRPQFINNKPVSPSLYRDLYLFGHRALVSTGHGNDIILVGETSPLAGTSTGSRSAMGPKQFVSELLCGPGTSGAGCDSFAKNGPIQAFAWAHHPYTKDRGPTVRDNNPDSITMANIDDLGTLLDSLAPTGHIRTGMPLMSTEFGWETNPPDPFATVTLDQQADFVQQSTLQTFLDPRLLANTQFLLRDVKPNKAKAAGSKSYWGTYQSGLETAGGGPKPALIAYMFPFLSTTVGHDPTTGGPVVNVFGQLRFLPNGTPSLTTVQFQWAPPGSNVWTTFAEQPVSNAVGYFSIPGLTLPAGAGQIRAAWIGPQVPTGIASRAQIAQ
jgi:hypothetical protein